MASWITDVRGIFVGHWTDPVGGTGCTVLLCEPRATAAVDVRGGAPGTRETDLLRPESTVQQVDAILLTGGSAFGLAAATGVMRFLEESGRGYPTPAGPVPIVPAAVVYDLSVGSPKSRPDEQAGYSACLAASGGVVAEGSVGAGTGATIGKHRGAAFAMRGGLGTAARIASDGTTVGALVVVNAGGDVYDPDTGRRVAGTRAPAGTPIHPPPLGNTTIGVIATDAHLDRITLRRLAIQGHNGLARCVRPVHTRFDGDTIFALATGATPSQASPEELGELAAEVVVESVLRAVRKASAWPGIPAVADGGA